LSGSIGIPPEGSGAGRLASALLASLEEEGERPRGPTLESGDRGSNGFVRGRPQALADQILADRLDGALIVAEAGDAEVARILDDGDLRLRAIGDALTPQRAVSLPFLGRARIAAGTYVGHDEAIETLGAQVVIAAPASRPPSAGGGGGPAAALASGGRRLPRDEVERLYEASGSLEVPDPALPSAWTSHRSEVQAHNVASEALDAVLNVLCVAFVVWIVLAVVRRKSIAAG
jgi:hypothetical protein